MLMATRKNRIYPGFVMLKACSNQKVTFAAMAPSTLKNNTTYRKEMFFQQSQYSSF